MPTTPRKKKGIAETIREKLTLNRPEFMRSAADNTRTKHTGEDFGLADRVERRQRAEMKPDDFDKKFGRR